MYNIILIHGSHHGAWCYDKFKEKFKKENNKNIINIYYYELLGHGLRHNINKYTIDEYTTDFSDFLENKKNLIIISHSLSCYIVYNYLIKYKNTNIIKAFFLAPSINISLLDFPIKAIYNMIVYGNFGNKSDVKKNLFYNADEETINFCYENLDKINHTKAIYMPANEPIDNTYIYLIIGKNDRLIPFYKVKKLQNIFKNSEYKCFDYMGHNLMLDNNWEEVYYYIIKNI